MDEKFVYAPDFLEAQRLLLEEKVRRFRRALRREWKGRSDAYRRHKTHTALPAAEQALENLVRGTYGFCIDCKEPISVARLKVVPSALRCRKCQGKMEAKS